MRCSLAGLVRGVMEGVLCQLVAGCVTSGGLCDY